jgi:hypothetical protein
MIIAADAPSSCAFDRPRDGTRRVGRSHAGNDRNARRGRPRDACERRASLGGIERLRLACAGGIDDPARAREHGPIRHPCEPFEVDRAVVVEGRDQHRQDAGQKNLPMLTSGICSHDVAATACWQTSSLTAPVTSVNIDHQVIIVRVTNEMAIFAQACVPRR